MNHRRLRGAARISLALGVATALVASAWVLQRSHSANDPSAAHPPAGVVTADYAAQPLRVESPRVELCQACGPCGAGCGPGCNPAAPHPIWGVDSAAGCCQGEVGWDSRGMIDWQAYAQGEYVGHSRSEHVSEYRMRVDDTLAIYFLRTREVLARPYSIQVGDRLRVESLTAGGDGSAGSDSAAGEQSDDSLNRELVVQPDGMITLPLIGRVPAAGRAIEALQQDLEKRFEEYYTVPAITVTPIVVNTRLEDLLETVDSRGGNLGGRQINAVVTPAGEIQLPGLGSVRVQSLTLEEAKMEIDARYDALIPGVSVTLALEARAPRFLYVLGEVTQPGQFQMTGPTTLMQAIALAGGWNNGANLRQVVVFRRGDDWRLQATMVDIRGALYGRRPVPADEIWLGDSDVVLVPKSPIEVADELIEQVFTRGIYAAVPLEKIWGQGFATVSAIVSGF
ncbi:Polysaccharide biosynthesis/export protein [Pseudobythopirellula maris]|uniref:Polysaccharide biosynthesis/export protein n=1 Tax=Pseudobythopirellula maris TaxID=2527991 RepID=A0A5C5ZN53_9BACT|nr:polysaccharide biosynthesis/export family protein [Pseudobythopirellula maris]TWT88934.1 Polysaccharide biosynthesis/export protein [Pseudobythopirellula maris]